MFLDMPRLFTLCPPAPAPYMPSAREQYLDALVNLSAAEASYLAFKAVEREKEVLAHRLRELQLRQQEYQLRRLAQYFSGDAIQTCGLYNLGAYQEDYPYMINLAEQQAFQAGHDRCRCDGLASSMCPCTYYTEVAPNPRLESWNPSSLDDVHYFTRVKPLLVPTSSFCRRARSFRRPHPLAFKHPFHTRRHLSWDNEQLKSIPLRQAMSISKPHSVEAMSNDELLLGFAKFCDIPTARSRRTESISGAVPPRAETHCERDSPGKSGFPNIFHTFSRSPVPDARTTPASEGEARSASGVPHETTPSEAELNTLPTALTTPSDNPSTADPPTEATIPVEISSFDKIRNIETSLNALKETFTLPVELDFLPSTSPPPSALSMSASDSDTESASATDHLTYSPLNRPVRSYEQALTVLLEQLDEIESLGDDDVRKSRREVVKSVERALEELERDVEGRRRVSVSEPLADKAGKVDNEGEDNGAVLGLGLDESEGLSEREDDGAKQNRFDDRADVVSGLLPEIIEQKVLSPAITTVSILDDSSAWTVSASTHGNDSTQATLEDRLEFSDATSVVNFPPSSAQTINPVPVEVTDSIPSPVLIASTTNSFSGDAEPGLSTSSPSFVLETASTTPSNANAIIGDHENTIPVDMPIETAVEFPTPSLEGSPTLSKSTELTASIQCADVEPEGFVLAFREADESVFEHPIVRNRDEDWLEVDV